MRIDIYHNLSAILFIAVNLTSAFKQGDTEKTELYGENI